MDFITKRKTRFLFGVASYVGSSDTDMMKKKWI